LTDAKPLATSHEPAAATLVGETDGRALAETQRNLRRAKRALTRFLEPFAIAQTLERARQHFLKSRTEDATLRKAAEWFLDNYYLIRRVARQVDEELPRGFVRRLPEIASGREKGLPRVYALARALVVRRGIDLDAAAVRRFVESYQEVSPLTIAELWALPIMLRVSVLRGLLECLHDLHVVVVDEGPVETLTLDPGVGVERAVRALRLLADIDWKAFFEQNNRVEAVLRRDPAQVYARMEFDTCDAYRKTVEELAWATGRAEEEVASLAITLASERLPDERRGHVGFHLVDDGRRGLEDRLGYRPRGVDRFRRALRRWPTFTYLASLAVLTAAPLPFVGRYVALAGGGPLSIAASVMLALGPSAVVAVAVLQWALAHVLAPRVLPKLDFAKGIPENARSLVVMPTLFGRRDEVDALIRQIELHYLSNPDPRLDFALLADDVDSKTMSKDCSLVERAARGIVALNDKHGKDGVGPFHLLHRTPRWNPGEERFMGWERKRGKLEELNGLLRGQTNTSYERHVGDPKGLVGIRFVITLDSDTQLPMGSAARLVGLLAHPLNRAAFDEGTGRVVAGYTIVQPRIETAPSSARETRFSRIFAGDVGLDIYTHAVSDSYQDLFSSGIYVGKGIYDVDAFTRSVEGRVPENAIASHDLFEGVHGRTALATDVVLFEGYPQSYAAHSRRLQRWVRGDWQLLPWLMPKVPSGGGGKIPNPLLLIDRWKIADNLRRSLTSALLLLLLVSGWAWLPGKPLTWTIGALAVLAVPLLHALSGTQRRRVEGVCRYLLAFAFLAHEAALVVDAMMRVVVRMSITRKHLLEWTSAAHTAFGLGGRSPRAVLWREMYASPLLALAIGALVAFSRPSALVVAAPFLAMWFLAPEIARWVSRPARTRDEPLRAVDRQKLRRLARRTWLFFETFVGPGDQWLPVDNYQAEPREQIAHRTSPTNVGMMLLSTLSAYDFGYLGPSELSLRLRSAFDTIERLSHYQGHLLNWYETKNLQPLLPRYVSTVDSGNFAGCLLALEQGCRDVTRAPVLRAATWEGLIDTLDVLQEVMDSTAGPSTRGLGLVAARIRSALERGRDHPGEGYATIRTLCDDTSAEFDRELIALLETGAYRHEAETLHALRTWTENLHQQLQQVRRELDSLLPWLAQQDELATPSQELPEAPALHEIPGVCDRRLAELDRWEAAHRERGELSPDLEASARRVREALGRAATTAKTLEHDLLGVATRAEEEVRGMDFRLLFDRERKLFHIGYNVTLDQIDAHHYDLLASEARLASYVAIVKREVPESHWYALGRPMTRIGGAPALLSWGGTMFEYLMPNLLMRSREGTLLAQTCALVVDTQVAWMEGKSAPWGVSESAYARIDAHHTYQYRSFGVPGLGFKRGLEDDLVVAPYASVLAVSIRPRTVVANLAKLEAMGMLGTYGLFDAIDLRPERVPDGRPYAVVRSYMAHHQGMLLVALDNCLHRDIMIDRFHADALVETGEMLLNERAPAAAPAEWPITEHTESDAYTAETAAPVAAAAPWSPHANGRPQAFVLSNGRLTSLLTDSGGGGLLWQGLALTRYGTDRNHDQEGLWIYLRDEQSGRVWLATSEQGRTTYAGDRAEFHRREQGISIHVDVAIAPADDVETRRVSLHNETDLVRRLSVTSAGEPVLLAVEQAMRHQAFTKLFVESEAVSEIEGLVFTRRPQSATEDHVVLVHRLVRDASAVTYAGYETDRLAFVGRGGDARTPHALSSGRGPLRGRTGAVLDPVMSLMAVVELRPKATVTLAFVTTVARARSEALDLARRYGSMHAVRWAFRDAEQESLRRLGRVKLDPQLLPCVQRLYSALLFADPAFRASPDVLVSGRPAKNRLWGRGISGDDPILLVRVHDAQAPLLHETLAAHRYLRLCGVRIDVVLFDEQASGYLSEGSETLRSVLAESGADDWVNRRGGIFVFATDQNSEDERRHLEACARAVLDTRDGSLAARLATPGDGLPQLPRLEATRADDSVAGPVVAPPLVFDNEHGGFSEDGREYVVRVRPGQPTPGPWCNVLANPDFGCLVSESSLGSTWSLNAGENRLTPWRNDPVLDTPSEALYLRDEETTAIWSPTPLPAGQYDDVLVRHGAGYTSYTRRCHGLEQELTILVPPDAPLKVLRLRLKNTLTRHRRLTATYYAEWVLGTLREEQQAYITSEFVRTHACLFARCSWNAEFSARVAFVAAERDVHGFTADRTEFLGRRGDYARPPALERWGLASRVGGGLDPCAALQVHIEIAPGEEIETHFVLGQAAGRQEALELVARYRDRATVDAAALSLKAFWDDILGSVRVKTPEPSMDLLLNRWLLYQSLSSRLFGRTGFYQSSGAFGYRDQLQDVLALLHAAPARARAHILEAAAHQFEEGDVLHWWHPPSGRGVRTRCSDDMLWLPYVVAEYVSSTGDSSILHELVASLTGDTLRGDEHDRYAKFEALPRLASLFEHCRRALERGSTQGRHGLPLMGDGDWNDGMNRVGSQGRGESVWLAWFLIATIGRFADLCGRMNNNVDAEKWRSRAESLRAKTEACAWDGGWYLRAFHDDGSLLGSAKARECTIDSIAQSWAVLSGAADPERAHLAVRAAYERLVLEQERLVLLLRPPFDNTKHDPGYIRAYPPGIRENGGQYTHAATWLGWAHAQLGDGAGAEHIFQLLNPILRTRTSRQSDRYVVEPYVLAGDVYGRPPWLGRGGWTWYTGAAAWAYRLGVEAILGLHWQEGQLRVDPCIPPTWNGFEAWVRHGTEEIHVVVENPDAVSTGVASVTVDGVPLDSNRVALASPTAVARHEVRVRLGKRIPVLPRARTGE
jgi:cyclic beta-1,2-glucan synthetase